MIKQAEFLANYRGFRKGEKFDFRAGVNLLVGDQGAGKSTLLNAIAKHGSHCKNEGAQLEVRTDKATTTYCFDFEKDSPRSGDKIATSKTPGFTMRSLFSSHGESVKAIISTIVGKTSGATFIMDEPDMALSIRSINKLVEQLKASARAGNQILAAIHNPLLIQAFPDVLSLEHRVWMSSADFIGSHMSPAKAL